MKAARSVLRGPRRSNASGLPDKADHMAKEGSEPAARGVECQEVAGEHRRTIAEADAEARVLGIQHKLQRQTTPDVCRMGSWRAGCGESRTSGSEGGPEKPTDRKVTGRWLILLLIGLPEPYEEPASDDRPRRRPGVARHCSSASLDRMSGSRGWATVRGVGPWGDR